jgi:hypothetical protein
MCAGLLFVLALDLRDGSVQTAAPGKKGWGLRKDSTQSAILMAQSSFYGALMRKGGQA